MSSQHIVIVGQPLFFRKIGKNTFCYAILSDKRFTAYFLLH